MQKWTLHFEVTVSYHTWICWWIFTVCSFCWKALPSEWLRIINAVELSPYTLLKLKFCGELVKELWPCTLWIFHITTAYTHLKVVSFQSPITHMLVLPHNPYLFPLTVTCVCCCSPDHEITHITLCHPWSRWHLMQNLPTANVLTRLEFLLHDEEGWHCMFFFYINVSPHFSDILWYSYRFEASAWGKNSGKHSLHWK